jgi:hypothetical protein
MGIPASAWRDRPTEIVEAGPSEEIFEKPRHPSHNGCCFGPELSIR